jgi:hypothetical protein
MLFLLQWFIGVLIALLLWNVFKLTVRTVLWLLGLLLFIGVVLPSLLLLIGGFTFLGIGLLSTLGLLLLISVWLDG